MKFLIILNLLGLSLAYIYNENKPPELNCDCGWKNEKLFGGTYEQILYPWMAGLLKDSTFLRAATIITEWHIVTASEGLYRIRNEKLTICVGAKIKNLCVKDGGGHEVDDYYQIWEAVPNEAINDIAILSSKTKFLFNSVVGPACLPDLHITNKKIENNEVKIFTWGGNKILLETNVLVAQENYCIGTPELSQYWSKSHHICTYLSGYYTCDLDRGGPVVQLDSVTRRYNLIGLLSYSPFVCSEQSKNKPSLSTNVSGVLEWMTRVVEDKPGTKLCTRS